MIWRAGVLTPDVAAAAAQGGATPTTLTPGAGSVVFTGFAPTVVSNTPITPGASSVVFTGFAPTISNPTPTSLTPGVGSVLLAGLAPSLTGLLADTTTTGSGDDIRRKKWLEWSRKKAEERKKKARTPPAETVPRETQAVVAAELPAEPIQIVDTAPRAVLLAANLAAIRAQEAAIAATVAGLRDLAAEARDEEEAEMLALLG